MLSKVIKKNTKPRAKTFYVQSKSVSTKPFILPSQAILFSNGTILVGYDVWRSLQHDCPSDPEKEWFPNMNAMKEKYDIKQVSVSYRESCLPPEIDYNEE